MCWGKNKKEDLAAKSVVKVGHHLCMNAYEYAYKQSD